MKEAGLPHAAAEEAVSEEDKQTLLAFLKRATVRARARPRKSPSSAKLSVLCERAVPGKRTVNVEVRKKRTYVKRDEEARVHG